MTNNHQYWFLENIDLEGMLCPTKLGEGQMRKYPHKTFKKGEYIYLPEEDSDKMYFITEGRVKIGTYSPQGKEITKAILNSGEVFGELSLIGEGKRRDFAYVMETTTMCILDINEMRSLMKEHGPLSMMVMKIIGNRAINMERRLESLVFKDSRTRIVEFLYNLALEKGKKVGFEREVRKFITHQEIANLTATSRQTVTTVLNELRNDNILIFDRRRMLVRDMDKLKMAGLEVA